MATNPATATGSPDERAAASDSAAKVHVPPLWCPLEPRIHPQADRIENRIHPWMAKFGFDARSLRRATTARAGDYASRVAPDGDERRLQIFADWTSWAFTFDDYYVDGGPSMARPDMYNPLVCRMMARVAQPESLPLDDNLHSAALRDLSQRLRACSPPAQAQRWITSHYMWLLGAACSVSDRSRQRTRSLDDHLIIGPLDRAEALTTLSIEISEGTDLPAQQRDLPHVRAITDAAHVLHTCYNDIASYRHELYQESPESNLVHVLQAARSCPPQEAMVAAVAMVDRIMRLFLDLRDQVAATASPELRRYLTQLSNKIKGNSDYQRTVPRYKTTLDIDPNTAPEQYAPTSPTVPLYEYSDAPSDTRYIPPAASIAWWWDLLDQ